MNETLREFAVRTGNLHLLDEWDDEKNAPLTPDDVLTQSGKKVWWRCALGHSFQTMVKSRVNYAHKDYCPICDGKQVLKGFNDLATLRPDLAKEWHPTLNGDLTPDKITVSSNKAVWWICDKGHVYKAAPNHRANKSHPTRCPYCMNRKLLQGFNALATVYPEIARQWHPTLNGDLTPDQVFPGSGKKVWWQCSEGHAWQTCVCMRTGPQKTGCPVCAGNVKRRRE